MYGFCGRWYASADGHTLFRLQFRLRAIFGQAHREHISTVNVEEYHVLSNAPGSMSDVEPDIATGRIGRVLDSTADKCRLYA